MAIQGTSIAKTNFNTSWTDNGISYNWDASSSGNVYYCGSSFIVKFSTDYNLWQSGRGTGRVAYYNNVTESWIEVCAMSIKGNGTQSFKFNHNRSAETTNYSDTAESHNHHVWRLHWDNYYSNSRWRITIYGGGPGMMVDTEYDTYCKNRLIISKGQISSNVYRGSNWTSGYDDTGALAYFNPLNLRGTKIFAGYEAYMIPKWI
jgi:hypothetical protein